MIFTGKYGNMNFRIRIVFPYHFRSKIKAQWAIYGAGQIEGMTDQPGVGRGPRKAGWPTLLNVSSSGSGKLTRDHFITRETWHQDQGEIHPKQEECHSRPFKLVQTTCPGGLVLPTMNFPWGLQDLQQADGWPVCDMPQQETTLVAMCLLSRTLWQGKMMPSTSHATTKRCMHSLSLQ